MLRILQLVPVTVDVETVLFGCRLDLVSVAWAKRIIFDKAAANIQSVVQLGST